MSWIKAEIKEGKYKGKTIQVKFGKPLQVMFDGKDITNITVALRIDLSANGHLLYLKIPEMDYSQFPADWLEKEV